MPSSLSFGDSRTKSLTEAPGTIRLVFSCAQLDAVVAKTRNASIKSDLNCSIVLWPLIFGLWSWTLVLARRVLLLVLRALLFALLSRALIIIDSGRVWLYSACGHPLTCTSALTRPLPSRCLLTSSARNLPLHTKLCTNYLLVDFLIY